MSVEAVQRGAQWLRSSGSHADVVISSRVRLARNLWGLPFLHRCSRQQRGAALNLCKQRLLGLGLCPQMLWVDVHTLPQIDRNLLVERHLISKEHAKGPPGGSDEPRGLAVSLPDESLSIMVNEEDHLRMQVLQSGLSLSEGLHAIDRVDDAIESVLDYAYSPRFGYLTACPTNVGCGIRLSAMLHLPALKLLGDVEKVRRAAQDMALAVRGFYGEGSEATGDLYQISNQTTLGKGEAVLLRELETEIIPQVIEYERAARRILLERKRRTLEDHVFRALGVLRSARLLAPDEALTMLSLVRLGVLAGLITDVPEQEVSQLFVLVQPAHLQRLLGRELDQQKRREARADLLRQRLGAR
ncbi:MAG: protein arginine kinase [Phycisphaeraceae bacterium]|nr:protein arginine kinase [Phycisphaeraceae bacterium]